MTTNGSRNMRVTSAELGWMEADVPCCEDCGVVLTSDEHYICCFCDEEAIRREQLETSSGGW